MTTPYLIDTLLLRKMDELIACLRQYGSLDSQHISLIERKLDGLSVPKGTYFSQAGKVASQIGFITQGIMRICYYNKEGDEFTRSFRAENQFVGNTGSFFSGMPCGEYIEALSNCQLLVISKDVFAELADSIDSWNDLFLRITSQAMLTKVQATGTMLGQDATARHGNFLAQNPGLVNRIPLFALASYLGITQSSLSRIRKKYA